MDTNIKNTTPFYCNNNTRFVFMDGIACSTIDDCYNALQQQLSIPNYFGKNLDALEEVLADLEWVNEGKVVIIISNLSQLLANDLKKKNDFFEILESGENKKIEVVYLG